MAGVGIICFAGSYVVALALELTRLVFRSGVRGALMLGWAGAGLVAHTAYLYYHAVSATGVPLSSDRDWFLVAAWLLVVVYLYLTYYHPRVAFGLFLLPLVLALIGAGVLLASPQPYAREPASQVWGTIHGASIVLAIVAVLVGFVSGVMYLSQSRRLKQKRPLGRGLRLPSLEWLERANGRAVVAAVVLLAAGVGSGMVLNLVRQGPSGRLPWYDPLVMSTLLMLGWLLLAVVLGSLYKPVARGRRVAYLTVASFVFLVIALGVGLLMNSQHGGRRVQGSGFGVQEPASSGERSGFRVQDSDARDAEGRREGAAEVVGGAATDRLHVGCGARG